MKTLDPTDAWYRSDYENGDDGLNFSTAHGFNYHQGPEWVWLMGFYLKAVLHFQSSDTVFHPQLFTHNHFIKSRCWHVLQTLRPLILEIAQNEFHGLPELTQADGRFCADSCANQAWSTATLLDLLYMLRNCLEEK